MIMGIKTGTKGIVKLTHEERTFGRKGVIKASPRIKIV